MQHVASVRNDNCSTLSQGFFNVIIFVSLNLKYHTYVSGIIQLGCQTEAVLQRIHSVPKK